MHDIIVDYLCCVGIYSRLKKLSPKWRLADKLLLQLIRKLQDSQALLQSY